MMFRSVLLSYAIFMCSGSCGGTCFSIGSNIGASLSHSIRSHSRHCLLEVGVCADMHESSLLQITHELVLDD